MSAYIVGVSMTRFGRRPEDSVKTLSREAIVGALGDAGCAAADIDFLVFSNVLQGAIEGQVSVRGQVVSASAELDGVPALNVENACASGSSALNVAVGRVLSGQSEVVVVVGVEKMFHPDKQKRLAAFGGGWDIHDGGETFARIAQLGASIESPALTDQNIKGSPFMDVYAAFAKFHMEKFGVTQRQIASVAAKSRQYACHNPLAHFTTPMSVEEILAAPVVSWPLTLPMCSPISDGAAAAIVCSGRELSRFPNARPVRISASTVGSARERTADDYDNHVSRRTALRAYELAGVSPDEIDVAEVHDASAFAEILQTENLGFFPFGEGGPMAERGATGIGGKIPVNVSGGMVSKGHPVGASGLAQIHELVQQLRGAAGPRQVEGARVAIAENGGGLKGVEEAAVCVTILERMS